MGKILCYLMLYMFVIPRMSSLDAVIDEHEALDFTRACENANFRSDQKQVRQAFLVISVVTSFLVRCHNLERP